MIGTVGPNVSSVIAVIEWSTSASTVGSKKRPAPSRTWPPAVMRAPAARACSTWVAMVSSCGPKVIAPTSTLAGPFGGPTPQRLHPLGDGVHEPVVDRRLHVDALDRHAGLAAVLHRVVGRGVGGALEVGVGEHDHRVLAAELEPDRRQRLGRPRHHLLAGRGRAGEHHEVDLVDQRLRGVGAADHDLDRVLGQPALAEAVGEQQRGERRHLRRLEDDGVAGRQGGDRVAEVVGQRVVPRADHAHDPDRPVADEELAAEHERVRGADLLVGQVLGRALGPEPERARAVRDLGHARVLVRLAALVDDRLDHPVGVVDQPLLHPPQHAGAAVEAERLPRRLGGAGARHQPRDLVGGGDGQGADDLAGGRVLDFDGVGSGRALDRGHGLQTLAAQRAWRRAARSGPPAWAGRARRWAACRSCRPRPCPR